MLSKQSTIINSLSKILASVLFVTLPFLGFYLGMEYEKTKDTNQTITIPVLPSISPVDDSCSKIPDPGTCLAHIPSYYFEQGTGRCKEFIWGGCEGVRPFKSFDKCQESCLGISWVEFKAYIIPFTVKVPSDWKKIESNIESARNQKTVTLSSPDFSYEGSKVAKGFNFMVGPINDGMVTYQTFEDFAKGQKQDRNNYYVFINGIKWMKSNTSATTLYNNRPLTIEIEANENQKEESALLFKQILSTFEFLGRNFDVEILPLYKNPLYCEQDSDCILQKTSCNHCSCAKVINKYNQKELVCPTPNNPQEAPKICTLACPEDNRSFKLKCENNKCTGYTQP